MFAEELWHDPQTTLPTFEVRCIRPLPAERLTQHAAVLIGAVCAVHSLGASRRRGLGWVTIGLHSATGLPGGAPRLAGVAATLLAMGGAA